MNLESSVEMKEHYKINSFIEKIRNLDENILLILTNGGCYKFAKLLEAEFPGGSLYINKTEGSVHVLYKYFSNYYDIRGLIPVIHVEGNFNKMQQSDIDSLHPEMWSSTKIFDFDYKKNIKNELFDNNNDNNNLVCNKPKNNFKEEVKMSTKIGMILSIASIALLTFVPIFILYSFVFK